MIKVKYENLVINLLIVLKEKYKILEISNLELEIYKKYIFKGLKTEGQIINISESKEDYSKYINKRKVYEDFYIYSLNPEISLDKLKELFYDGLSTKYKEVFTNENTIENIVESIKDNKTSRTYNKLVRDKIPGVLALNKEKPIVSIIPEKYQKEELYKALSDIYEAFVGAPNIKDKINNSIDLVEIISCIIKVNNGDDLIELVLKRRKEDGSYDKMFFLEKVESNLKVED